MRHSAQEPASAPDVAAAVGGSSDVSTRHTRCPGTHLASWPGGLAGARANRRHDPAVTLRNSITATIEEYLLNIQREQRRQVRRWLAD